MTLGKPCLDEVAKVANELAWEFLLLGTCFIEKALKLDCSCLILPRYHCILWSLASNSPFTCLMISLESEKTSTTLPSSFFTIIIPARRASYSASLFVAGKPSRKDFSIVTCLGDTRMIPIPDPFWLAVPSTKSSQNGGWGVEISETSTSTQSPQTLFPFKSHINPNQKKKNIVMRLEEKGAPEPKENHVNLICLPILSKLINYWDETL